MELKIAFLIILISVSNVLAIPTYSQVAKVSLDMENKSLEQVMDEIELQTEFYFIFNQKQIDVNRVVDIQAENKLITDILPELFKGTNVNYAVFDRKILLTTDPLENSLLAIASGTELQQKVVSGIVTDASTGEIMPGVNIQVKGTTIGMISGADGRYSLSFPARPDAVLAFSFIGYVTQEIPVAGKVIINVTLQAEVTGLEEVVVIGYGTAKKETLTGSVASITATDIVTTKSENLISNIQGKISGLMIRQRTGEPGVFNNTVSIRGFGSPLVIIDGIARDATSDMAQLNPNDIESMSILKDAAASIYGMNAANGVIIITTKKGLEGKAQFSYSNLFGMKGATGIDLTVDAYTYRVMKNEMDRNTGAASQTYSDDVLQKFKDGVLGYTDINWINLCLYKWVFQQNHNFSVRGGNNIVKYFNSFGYTEDNGLMTSGMEKYRRYNFRSTTTADISKNVKLNVSIGGRFDNNQSPREGFLWNYKTIIVNDRGINYHTLANPDHLTAIAPEDKNPWALINPSMDGYQRSRNFQVQTTVDLTWNIQKISGLSLTATGAFDVNNSNSSSLQKSYDLYNYYTDAWVKKTGADSYSNTLNLGQRAVVRGQANYLKSFGKHRLNVTAVTEFTATRSDNVQAGRNYSDLFTNDIINQGTSTTASNSGSRGFGRYAAYIGRINYDYAGKYLLEGVARYDGSYRYAPGHRWALFPSISLGWRISEEAFIKDNLPIITNLKLRGSYGEGGSDAGNAFAYYSAYSANSGNGYVFNDGALTVGMVAPGVVNDQLSWVTSKISNIGIDFDLWNGKLGGSAEAFSRAQTGKLATLIESVPNTFGASFPQVNLNSSQNIGFELSLSHRGKIGRDLIWGATANFTYTRYKDVYVERNSNSNSWDNWRNNPTNRFSGRQALYDWSGQFQKLEEYETAPIYGGSAGNSKMLPGSYRLIDLNGDGVINSSDNDYNHWAYGNLNPPKQYGLTLNASYKGFDVSLLLQGASGYSINYKNNDIWGYGRYPTMMSKFLDRWHTVNITDNPQDPATQWVPGFFPALRNYNYDNTQEAANIDIWIPDATYLRLKSVEIGYNIPKGWAKKVGMENARVFVNGYNLLTWCNKLLKNADPEREESDWSANLAYPLMKSFNFGVNFNF